MKTSRRTLRRITLSLGIIFALGGPAVLLVCDRWVAGSADGRIYASAEDAPARDVALVLGTKPTVSGGRQNLYFKHRIDAAAALFHGGKVRHVLVSGDNHTRDYDEPSAMRDALVERGVPAAAITLDYAGFRTLDSVVRAREVFGQHRCIIVSQQFHAQRALFIADRRGIDAIALAAKDVAGSHGVKVRAREVVARARAVLDVCVLGTAPRFPGRPEPIALAR